VSKSYSSWGQNVITPLFAVKFSREPCFYNIILEGDALQIVNMVSKKLRVKLVI
jgi:hypothetical protein